MLDVDGLNFYHNNRIAHCLNQTSIVQSNQDWSLAVIHWANSCDLSDSAIITINNNVLSASLNKNIYFLLLASMVQW